jgi:hypothetical protein
MPERQFYTEVVIVTIMTWIAANAWTSLSNKVIAEEFGNSNFAYFLVAIGITIAAILILNHFFTEGEKNPKHVMASANFVKRNGKYAEQEGYTNDVTDSTSCPCGGVCSCDSCGK